MQTLSPAVAEIDLPGLPPAPLMGDELAADRLEKGPDIVEIALDCWSGKCWSESKIENHQKTGDKEYDEPTIIKPWSGRGALQTGHLQLHIE